MSASRLNVQNTAASPVVATGCASLHQPPATNTSSDVSASNSTHNVPYWRNVTASPGSRMVVRPVSMACSRSRTLRPTARRNTRSVPEPSIVRRMRSVSSEVCRRQWDSKKLLK